MLTLFVIACHVMDPTQCITLQDIRGKHVDMDACEVRANEMAADMVILTQGAVGPVRWQCLDDLETAEFLGLGEKT